MRNRWLLLAYIEGTLVFIGVVVDAMIDLFPVWFWVLAAVACLFGAVLTATYDWWCFKLFGQLPSGKLNSLTELIDRQAKSRRPPQALSQAL